MPNINITDSRKRDAVVKAENTGVSEEVRYVDSEGSVASTRKVLKATVAHDFETLNKQFGDDPHKLGYALIEGDPEVDMERCGVYLWGVSKVYVTTDDGIVYRIEQTEKVLDTEGQVKETRPRRRAEANVDAEIPLTWTGRKIRKSDAIRRFLFTSKLQIVHVNGLTYDFLYGMAAELDAEHSLMMIGGGSGGKDPLVFRRGSVPYRGFLEGRVDGEQYILLLHLSNMELKVPESAKDTDEVVQETGSSATVDKKQSAPDKPKNNKATGASTGNERKQTPSKKPDFRESADSTQPTGDHVKKVAAKKTASKTTVAKKTVAKKTAAKKAVVKKAVAKKAVAKKTGAKKAAAKKTIARKAERKTETHTESGQEVSSTRPSTKKKTAASRPSSDAKVTMPVEDSSDGAKLDAGPVENKTAATSKIAEPAMRSDHHQVNTEDLGIWLKSIRMGKYLELFVANEIDVDVLSELTDDDLKELEIPLGSRRRLLKAVAEADNLRAEVAMAVSKISRSNAVSAASAKSAKKKKIKKKKSALKKGWQGN